MRRWRGTASDDDPLAYMTSDSPSPYLIESRMAMLSLFFARGRTAQGWRRWLILILRALVAAFLVLILIQVGSAIVTTL